MNVNKHALGRFGHVLMLFSLFVVCIPRAIGESGRGFLEFFFVLFWCGAIFYIGTAEGVDLSEDDAEE